MDGKKRIKVMAGDMPRSGLVAIISRKMPRTDGDGGHPFGIEGTGRAVAALLDRMAQVLAEGGRVEVRGFGSFSPHHRQPRKSRNPKTGETVMVPAKRGILFKPSKEMKALANRGRGRGW